MKIKGFTLGEVLITIAILGVVSALAIPSFTANVYNQANASRLSPITSDLENVFGSMLLKEDKDNIFETAFGTAWVAGNAANIKTAFESYTKITKSGTDAINDFGYKRLDVASSAPVVSLLIPRVFAKDTPNSADTFFLRNINGSPNGLSFDVALGIPNGAVIFFSDNGHTVYIDVNGSSMPNTYGRDVFAFALGEDGHLYPYGTVRAAELLSASNPSVQTWDNTSAGNACRCVGTRYTGLGCTARLIEHNYKVDY